MGTLQVLVLHVALSSVYLLGLLFMSSVSLMTSVCCRFAGNMLALDVRGRFCSHTRCGLK